MRALTLLSALTLTLFLTPASDAQCIGPDGLDSGTCCSLVLPNLPAFPPILENGLGFCWTDCAPPSTNCLTVTCSPPLFVGRCDELGAQLSVSDCSGVQLLSGFMKLIYVRTWDEEPVPGSRTQVWRFHAKVDLSQVVGAPPSCPVPSCTNAAGSTGFFYGYVDYALDCTTNTWDSVVVLFHNCDEFIHSPLYSFDPGPYHPGTTFAIVAPATSTTFVPTSAPAPAAAPLSGESLRSRPSVLPGFFCQAEDFVPPLGGVWLPIVFGCLCPLNLVPIQNSGVQIQATGVCGNAFGSVNAWPSCPGSTSQRPRSAPGPTPPPTPVSSA